MFMVKFPNVPQKLMKIPQSFAQVSNAIEAQASTLLEFVGDEAGPGICFADVLWMFSHSMILFDIEIYCWLCWGYLGMILFTLNV